jgi:hypothetical protein
MTTAGMRARDALGAPPIAIAPTLLPCRPPCSCSTDGWALNVQADRDRAYHISDTEAAGARLAATGRRDTGLRRRAAAGELPSLVGLVCLQSYDGDHRCSQHSRAAGARPGARCGMRFAPQLRISHLLLCAAGGERVQARRIRGNRAPSRGHAWGRPLVAAGAPAPAPHGRVATRVPELLHYWQLAQRPANLCRLTHLPPGARAAEPRQAASVPAGAAAAARVRTAAEPQQAPARGTQGRVQSLRRQTQVSAQRASAPACAEIA